MSDSVLHGRVLEELASWRQRAEVAEAEAKDMTAKAGNLLLRLTEAEKKLTEAQKDTERLDWVQDNGWPDVAMDRQTLRDCIDAARGQV